MYTRTVIFGRADADGQTRRERGANALGPGDAEFRNLPHLTTSRNPQKTTDLHCIFYSSTSHHHVCHVCPSSFYQLLQLRVVRGSLTFTAWAQLVHAFINSRLDYCNNLLAGVNDQLISQLSMVSDNDALQSHRSAVCGELVIPPIHHDFRSSWVCSLWTGCMELTLKRPEKQGSVFSYL